MRTGVVAIVVKGDRNVAVDVQNILHNHQEIIIGRMGVPDRTNNQSVIALIVNGTVEQISAMTGQLGRLDRVEVKSALTSESN